MNDQYELVLYGGKFDCLTNAHIAAGRWVRDKLDPDKILFMVSKAPPHKRKGVSNAKARFKMVKAGIAGEDRFEASDLELKRPGLSYTVDTVEQLLSIYGKNTRISMILSSEYLDPKNDWYLPKWHGAEKLMKLCRFLVVTRAPISADQAREWAKLLPQAEFEIVDFPSPDVSSTMVRDRVARGESIDDLVPLPVATIIKEKGYYKPKSEKSMTNSPIRPLSHIYRTKMGLLTDLYQLTMGQAAFDAGMAEDEAVFDLHFRKNPFGGGFTVASGMAHTIDYIVNCFGFTRSDIKYLGSLKGNDGKKLFTKPYLEYLKGMKFTGDVDMVKEGTAVFPMLPMVRVRAPYIQGQIIETALLCMNNFASLIATKSARMRMAVGTDPYVDFGLRRAQGIDGSLMASWAAYVGGSDGTSNVLAGKLFRIPVKGTFAHSWVMSFKKELDAFFRYAESMGNNCTFLVDTYNTLAGVKNAIKVGLWLRERGYKMVGVRLDSGKLGDLSMKARKLLDEAGFEDAVIFATNDLDEYKITRLKIEGAKIGAWGIGTMMIVAYDQPALGGVYKLAAIRKKGETEWRYCVKLSEDDIKTSLPGIKQVRRFFDRNGQILGDLIYDQLRSNPVDNDYIDIKTGRRVNVFHFAGAGWRELLEPSIRGGKIVTDAITPAEARAHREREVASLPEKVRKLKRPARYPVYLESNLHEIRKTLIADARAEAARMMEEAA